MKKQLLAELGFREPTRTHREESPCMFTHLDFLLYFRAAKKL